MNWIADYLVAVEHLLWLVFITGAICLTCGIWSSHIITKAMDKLLEAEE